MQNLNLKSKKEQNQKISKFVHSTYARACTYRNYGNGRFYDYFLNYYKNKNTMKFAIFDDCSKININLLKDFLKANNINYLDVRLIPSYGYSSLIIDFAK